VILKKVFMKDKTYTLENIKNQAKKIRRQGGIKHTEALDIVAIALGYHNWKHCQKMLKKISLQESKTTSVSSESELASVTFNQWLSRHKNRNSPLGDLAKDMLNDDSWPICDNLTEYEAYFLTKDFHWKTSQTLREAWKTHKRYLKRRITNLSRAAIRRKKSLNANPIPKIVYVKNVVPLHFSQRTVEKFRPGQLAWISRNGRKALPVTILDSDDRYYTFRFERPLKNAGDEHYLYLDEVRSTPELACLNRITS
jgi:hypothetical protein